MNNFRLHDHKKTESGFKAPDAYFDNFASRLLEQLPEPGEAKVIPLYRRRAVWLSVAASFAILLATGLFLTTVKETTDMPQPDNAAIEHYLVYQANINSYDLMQDLDTEDLAEMEQSIPVSDEAIEEYLYDKTIEDLNE
ncbi:hypothetical protein [uncultured Flavobacterium sp.]|uniref:hypothetical protein n=1 Tax=uncultured Flavobacterium sp. TaxID=165435 RepID=UPI0025D9918C|nr:hypothetical protein [uncultured Flavobacterium sp.]